ncbi:NmrA-like family protein [Cucurbitaria berberidis CBS 394.84]|uniref:NmrA-like family protein n=1 Tax=Cucurbitaria berberidis CBS 394.84 TaxID=1168544 RepID=A0A9P4GVP2_9PLEO|nr:NmrA-like family protein [Cucurbitaria berberidis CBS 394.84]KAF1852220.1 NmrA-like family protein [Cucurbitaria berberidis CBS 394.84]
MSRALLITGATGKQGGSVVNALLKANANFEILALTRNAQSASAQTLLKKSPKIKLVSGNLDAVDEVFRKAKEASKLPIWGVFSVQAAVGNGASAESDEKQGKALVDASLKNGVKQFVYTSVDHGGPKADDETMNVPHFKSKYEIEKHLYKNSTGSGMDWTVLQPVAFMENLVPGFPGKVFSTAWKTSLREDQKLQLVATSDIGFFAAKAFMEPEENKNKKIPIAGDELTYSQYQDIFEKKTGQTLPTTYGFAASAILWMVNDLGYMFKWFGDVGYGVDIPSLKKVHPELKDFGTWLETESEFKAR